MSYTFSQLLKERFRIFKIYIAPTTSIWSIFIFQSIKKKHNLKVLKKRWGRGKIDGSVGVPQTTSYHTSLQVF
jgi:hypothetical protein